MVFCLNLSVQLLRAVVCASWWDNLVTGALLCVVSSYTSASV